ncbi:MAG TPA: phospholipase D-like domain-containing protein [Ktedonobacteraceae bacterium]|nr:phospholipase D-like domain-containing protein [Ktedonobacteraceae bacterium]
MRITRRVLVTVVSLQVLTATILLLVAALRRYHRDKTDFPRRLFDDVQMGENSLRLYCYGRELYDDMLAAIDGAKESVYIESYIWKADDAGLEFKEHLARKAEEGVAVYVIFDSFANFVVPRSFKSFHPKIHVLEYQAFKHVGQVIDLRRYSLDHRKLLIVDGHIGFIGGYNIGSLYATSWRDTHLRVVGPASADLAHSFIAIWNRFCSGKNHSCITSYYPRRFDPFVILHGNDAMHLTFPIRDMYIEAINHADHHIYLTNAYFVPDHVLLGALKDAAQRGVDVRIMVPLESNHILVDWVSHSYYSECLEAGIHLLRYKTAMHHAKTCTIDGQWSTVGTANLDRLSSIGNYEINIEIYCPEFAQQMELLFACDATNVSELTLGAWLNRSWLIKFSEKLLAPYRFLL